MVTQQRREAARILVRPPSRPSASAQTVRRSLGTLARVSRTDTVVPQYKFVINWGNPNRLAYNHPVKVLNKPEAIANAINKLTAMRLLQASGVRVPAFQTEPPVDAASTWLARRSLTGSGGVGIEVVRKGGSFPAASLYVKYIKKTTECRVHVANGKAIFLQLKLRDSKAEQTADQALIRNHDNGWVFCPRPLDTVTQDTLDSSVAACAALGLDFGAVDLVLGRDDNLAYVLEVNSAPGLSSPGLIEAYRQAFTEACT